MTRTRRAVEGIISSQPSYAQPRIYSTSSTLLILVQFLLFLLLFYFLFLLLRLPHINNMNGDIVGKVTILAAEIGQLKIHHDTAQITIEANKAELAAAKNTIKERDTQIAEREAYLQCIIAQQDTRLDKNQRTIEDQKSVLAAANQTIKERDAHIKETEAELDAARDIIADQDTRLAENQRMIRDQKNVIEEIDERLQLKEDTIGLLERRKVKWGAMKLLHISELRKKITELEEEGEKKDARISNLEKKIGLGMKPAMEMIASMSAKAVGGTFVTKEEYERWVLEEEDLNPESSNCEGGSEMVISNDGVVSQPKYGVLGLQEEPDVGQVD